MGNLKRYKYKLTNPTTYTIEMVEDESGEYVKFQDVVAQNYTSTNKQSDVIPLWKVRDVLQGHFDYKTVNLVMDDME